MTASEGMRPWLHLVGPRKPRMNGDATPLDENTYVASGSTIHCPHCEQCQDNAKLGSKTRLGVQTDTLWSSAHPGHIFRKELSALKLPTAPVVQGRDGANPAGERKSVGGGGSSG